MSVAPLIKRLKIRAGEAPKLMSRVETSRGVPAVQSTFGSIAWKLFDVRNVSTVDPEAVVASGTLTVGSVIFDSLVTNDADWQEDSTGYNFKWQLPATNTTLGQDGAGLLRLEIRGTPASGEPFWLGIWLFEVADMLSI